jgi:hypothetical protein
MAGLLTLILTGNLSAHFDGEGTEENPYLIEDADQLYMIRDYLTSHFRQVSDIDLSDYSSGEGWEPINGFMGTYYGSGYSISKLFIDREGTDNVGLFGYTKKAILGGIKLIDFEICGKNNVGSLVGYSEDTEMYQIYTSGTVKGNSQAGGLAGKIDSGLISESHTFTTVKASIMSGGLAGLAIDAEITNCYSLGITEGEAGVGGLIGIISGNTVIQNCYAAGPVKGDTDFGGLIGSGSGTVENSYWDIETTGQAASAGGEGRDTEQMTYPYDPGTFETWKFNQKWLEDEEYFFSNGYPSLFMAPSREEHIPWPIFSGGDGTAQDPYVVEYLYQLNWIRHPLFIRMHFIQSEDIDLDEYPWNEGEGWFPIGTPAIPFGNVVLSDAYGNLYYTCSYNGNRYTIFNLFIDRESEHVVGFFGYINGAHVYDLNIESTYISGHHAVGVLAGAVRNALIERCSAYVEINAFGNFAGGLIGSNYYSFIHHCYSSGNVNAVGCSVGGLVGSNVFSHISGSQSSVNVTGINDHVGGLVGSNMASSTIEDCHSSGIIAGNYDIGGLAGRNSQSEILNSTSSASVNGYTFVGGLVGNTNDSVINNCYSNGDVNGDNYVGGLVGHHTSGSTLSLSSNSSSVNGDNYVGGLVGRNDNNAEIENCYNSGNITGTWNVGGLVGFNHVGLVNNSFYNYESVTINGQNIITIGALPNNLYSAWITNGLSLDINNYLTDSPEGYIVSSFNDLQKLLAFGLIDHYNYILTESIDLSGQPGFFIPYFTGVFDGDGNMIKGLHLDMGISSNIGLFGYVLNAAISGTSVEEVNMTGIDYVGGLIGFAYDSSVFLCSATGNVAGESNIGGLIGGNHYNCDVGKSYSNAAVFSNGYGHTGGLIGYNRLSSNVWLSYSTGSVTGSNGNAVGGLVGVSWSNSNIMNSYSSSTVSGDSQVGGLVGLLIDSVIGLSYSKGSVYGNSNVGGFIGMISNSGVGANYWDIVTSGQTESAGGQGVTGAMTVEMVEDNSLYSNWDFNTIWSLRDYTTYPYLQWQDEPGIHNYPPHGYHKVYLGREWYWESFPVLYDRDQYGYQSGSEVLDPLTEQVETLFCYDEDGAWIGYFYENWTGHILFHSTRGYQLTLLPPNEYSMLVEGDIGIPSNIAFSDSLEIDPEIEGYNFLGYFIPQTQCVFSAFDEVIDDLVEILSEDWGLYRNNLGEWEYDVSLEPKVLYGKMYKVQLHPDVEQTVSFCWNIPDEPEYWIPRPEPEFFTFQQKASYESYFIDYIVDDEDVLEVAVYADNECVGATVFPGVYPFEILAYTDESHANAVISFVIHRDSQRGEGEKLTEVEVKNNESGEYSLEVLKPLRQSYTVVRLHNNEHESEAPVIPEVTLYQNYPNPFTYTEASRSHLTEIPFYLPEEREVTLEIYNIRGQRVRTLFSGTASAGKHSVGWNGFNEQNRRVGSGIYFYRLDSGDKTLTRKMLLIR